MFVKLGTVAVESVLNKDEFNTRLADRKIVEYDPEYVYVVVRALTADKPNSNGDCFPHDELVRLDAVLHRPVYASFIGKGVYINHQHTDDPRYAKGIILDSRYVQGNADDKYVELLLGIDKQKDPVFARDVERGLINKFSMGASVQFTKCSVCSNEARRKEEFCEHIAKHKMREVKAEDGSKKLAYELCFGVTYNEISAVSDPADETAQLLHRIANSTPGAENRNGTDESANPSHGTVVLMNDIRTRLGRLEALIMANRTKTAGPLPSAAPTPPAAGGAGMDPAADPMGGAPTDDLMMESEEGGPVVEVLKIVEDLATHRIPAAEAVEALEQVLGGDPTSPEAAPGEQMGAPEPPPADMAGPTASAFSAWLKRVSKSAKERPNMATKTADDKSPKVENQYPYKKRQGDPKQFPNPAHDSRHESRPASDFDKDTKDYGKLTNVSAEFVPNKDRRLAGWRILDGETPVYMVTGANAWGDHLSEQWGRFASREYGTQLVTAILEDGLEPTMERVKAIKAEARTANKPETVLDNTKLLKAAEAKAADLAQEINEDFVVRFVEGIKLALKLQDKNVFDNHIKGAAWEVLTAAGLDGKLAEKIASGPVVEAHVDEAIRKALEYTEMSSDAFEEVKAQAEQMTARSITAAAEPEHGAEAISETEALAAMEDAAREHLNRRAGKNIGGTKMQHPGETPGKTYDEAITRAVRGNSAIHAAPTAPLSYGKRPGASA
jgi:hypothetical protein